MCGICGILDPSGEHIDRDALHKMTDAVTHRGPDASGYHVDDVVGLGFRRLSIIDLEHGHQPMSDPDGETWVVSNGEIYNFVELRRELEALGHRFRTRSDTEVIVHGYRAWGDDVLERLNGMFGLAVWDAKRKRLLLARDRAGVKPLYWTLDGPRLLFASEIRSLSEGMSRRSRVDPASLSLFLQLRYVPSPFTIFEGVHRLAPGEKLVADASGVTTSSWWDFRPEPLDPVPHPAAAIEELLECYEAALDRQLVSDVPLGLFLSGGLDSGLLLALMSRHGSDWPTFSIGFGQSHRGDELDDASATARAFGASHTSIELSRPEFEASLPEVVRTMEEPIASPSVVAMYHLSRHAAQTVKVALMGQGPDELLGGYRRHLGIRYGSLWRVLPHPVRTVGGAVINSLPRAEALKRGITALAEPERLERWRQALSVADASRVERLFRPDLRNRLGPDRVDRAWEPIVDLSAAADELSAFSYLEVRSSLPDELLLYADKLSMAHGLEVRVPYLDQEVIEYSLGLPARYKVHGRGTKWIHRRACRRHLASEAIRRPKRGFAVDVVDDWYRSSVRGILEETLLDPTSLLYEMLEPGPVQDLIVSHRSGREDNHKLLHSLVVAELWMREFVS
jgi:asparagine synthase (glutamine-hydrolysing)